MPCMMIQYSLSKFLFYDYGCLRAELAFDPIMALFGIYVKLS